MKLTGNKSQCSACKQVFSSVSAFDRHRIGKHGKDRRCMTEDEMREDVMRLVNGLWKGEAYIPSANTLARNSDDLEKSMVGQRVVNQNAW